MLTYKAMYKFEEDGVSARVLDFPGAISCGADLEEAREMLGGALIDMAETLFMDGEALPRPDPMATDPESDIEEPIYLLLTAASRIEIVPVSSKRCNGTT